MLNKRLTVQTRITRNLDDPYSEASETISRTSTTDRRVERTDLATEDAVSEIRSRSSRHAHEEIQSLEERGRSGSWSR